MSSLHPDADEGHTRDTHEQSGGRRPHVLAECEAFSGTCRAPLQRGDIPWLVVPFQLIPNLADSAQPFNRGQKPIRFVRENRSVDRHDPVVRLDVYRSRMRDVPTELRSYALDEHGIGVLAAAAA
jgi:hypothetical protein